MSNRNRNIHLKNDLAAGFQPAWFIAIATFTDQLLE